MLDAKTGFRLDSLVLGSSSPLSSLDEAPRSFPSLPSTTSTEQEEQGRSRSATPSPATAPASILKDGRLPRARSGGGGSEVQKKRGITFPDYEELQEIIGNCCVSLRIF